MCDVTREDLLDIVAMVAPQETPFLGCLLGTEIPLTQEKIRGMAFWNAILRPLHKLHVMPRIDFNHEDGWLAWVEEPRWAWRLRTRIRHWMERRGYEQKYLPPPARDSSCDWLTYEAYGDDWTCEEK